MNKLSSLRELLSKESGIYNVNGFNIKWDLESKTWQPSDIITLLRIIPQNAIVYNMLHHLDEELSIIDNWCDRFYSLTENKNLTSDEFAELSKLQEYFLKLKDGIYGTDEKISTILSYANLQKREK